MILGKDKLLQAERSGYIKISDRIDFSAFSLDITLDKLYRLKPQKILCNDEKDISQEEFIDKMLEPVDIDNGHIIKSSEFYLWQPKEKVFLSRDYRGSVKTRSSWARLGCCVRSESDEYLSKIGIDREILPLLSLNTTGTDVFVKKGNSIGQLFIDDCMSDYVDKNEEHHLINSGNMIIKLHGRTLFPENVYRAQDHANNLELSMDRKIRIYNKKTIIPGVNNAECFDTVYIDKPLVLRKGDFFLSCSQEYVEIPQGYLGYVTECVDIKNPGMHQTKPSGFPVPYSAHPNAPIIGPSNVFSGNITFENFMKFDFWIYRGLKQSELYLSRLNTDNHEHIPSRYMGQMQATTSRI